MTRLNKVSTNHLGWKKNTKLNSLTFGHVFVGKSFTNENKIHTIRNSNNPHETKQIPNLSLLRMNSYP